MTRAAWTGEIGEAPLDAAERRILTSDAATRGSGETALRILNASLEIASPHSRPKVLRVRVDGRLAGALFFMECRRAGACLFDPPLSQLVDLPGLAVFTWGRYGVSTDHFANPGFVASDVDRQRLVEVALEALRSRYLYGTLVDFVDAPVANTPLRQAAFDCGYVDVERFDSLDAYLGLRKTLRKKMNAFRNKGGSIETVRGALDTPLRRRIVALYATMQHRLLIPFQDIFAPLVGRTAEIDDRNLVHLIARLHGEIVGYHSFYVGGNTLRCLSGGFDRARHSTYHAYENVIIESVRFCLEHGLACIDYGPVLNETKVRMMTRFRTLETRTYVRWALMRRPLSGLLRRSVLARERIGRYRGLQEAPETIPARHT